MRRPISIQLLVSLFVLSTGVAQAATETIKLNLAPSMTTVADSIKLNQCKEMTHCEDFDFVAEVEAGKVVKAYFIDPLVTFESRIDLTPEEVAGISVFKDSYQHTWLKEMRFSDRLMKWTMSRLFFSFCNAHPTSLQPFLSTLKFNTEYLGEETLLSNTNCSEFAGKWKNASTEENFYGEYTIQQGKYQPLP